MSIQRIQEWLDDHCNAYTDIADGIVAQAGSPPAAPQAVVVARWTHSAGRDQSEALLRAAQSAMRTRLAIVENLQRLPASKPGAPRVVALPLLDATQATGAAEVIGAVALQFHDISAAAVDQVVDTLGLSCTALMAGADGGGGAARPGASMATADAVLQIQAALLSHARFDEAAAVFATRVAQLLAFDRVSVGLVDQGYARVAAISHGAAVDARQELTRSIAAAMDEAIDQGATISLPAASGTRTRITLAHAALRRGGGGSICSIPIVHLDAIAGAVTLERSSEQALSAVEIERCEHIVNLAGPVLALKAESEVSALARMRRACARQWRQLREPGAWPFKLALAATMNAVAEALGLSLTG